MIGHWLKPLKFEDHPVCVYTLTPGLSIRIHTPVFHLSDAS